MSIMESIGSLPAENVMCVHNVIQHKVDQGKGATTTIVFGLDTTHVVCDLQLMCWARHDTCCVCEIVSVT